MCVLFVIGRKTFTGTLVIHLICKDLFRKFVQFIVSAGVLKLGYCWVYNLRCYYFVFDCDADRLRYYQQSRSFLFT